jgi:phage terminase large subunit-like protein
MQGEVDFYIRGAHNPDGSLYFPERFTEAKLKELRKLHGSYIYSCFYNNNPIDEEEAIIKKSQIKYYDNPPEGLNVFCTLDPAISQGGQADSSAYITVGVASNSDWYVLEAKQEKSTVAGMVEGLFLQNNKWKPLTSAIEVIGQAQGLLSPIHDEEERRKIYLPLVEVKALPQVTKEMRIRSILQPRFERGSVYIKENMVELEEQLLKFPRAKKDDLCLSGDTLVFTSKGSIPIKNIRRGDMVLTRKGFRRVVVQEMTGIKKTISRFGLTATPNHPIITHSGIRDFNIVKASDIIHLCIKKPLSTTVKSTIDTRTRKEEAFEFTSGDTVQKFPFLYTDRYGLIIMGKFLLDLLFTIKTITHSTTKFLICNSCQIKNIVASTLKREANGLRKTSKSPKKLQNSGTKAKKGESGTNYTLKICGKILKLMKGFVFSVENFLRHTTKIPVFVKDLTVVKSGENFTQVYNLKIEGSHEFFANGILVHNCDALSMIESIAYEPQAETKIDDRVFSSKLEEQLKKPTMFERFADEVMGEEY